MRGPASGPISPLKARGSTSAGSRLLVPLDDALATGRLQAGAELGSFVGRTEGADHGPVVDTLLAEVGAFDQRRVRSEHRRELALERFVGSLCVGLATLRRYLHEISTTRAARARRGLRGIGRGHPGWRFGGSRLALRRERQGSVSIGR